ncbi:MAG: glycosyltransferase [Lachnospiraceae bacterium]|nr:glycosyltransferase [Lachnospiraceae bacterium]
MIRVLHVLGGLNFGGAESRIMDLYRKINRNRIQFDFCIHIREHCHYEVEVAKLGGRVFRVPPYRVYNGGAYKSAWNELLERIPDIQIVHGHMTSTAGIYLPLAKEKGKITIAHARSAGLTPGLKATLTKKLREGLLEKADYCLACSEIAGEAVFGSDFKRSEKAAVFPNAIDISKFIFDSALRNAQRKELSLDPETVVIGHVGQFCYAKNHEFLLKVFAKVHQVLPQSRLLMVGGGELKAKMEGLAKSLGIFDFCIFTGEQTNTVPFYQAMDLFVFPSHFEGLPGSVIEAQASGLPCLISDVIASETDATDLVTRMAVSEGEDAWVAWILNWASEWGGVIDREDQSDQIKKAGLDVTAQARNLASFYQALLDPEQEDQIRILKNIPDLPKLQQNERNYRFKTKKSGKNRKSRKRDGNYVSSKSGRRDS